MDLEVGDLVWYYPVYAGKSRYLCTITSYYDMYGLLFVVYDFERKFAFTVSKSCIKRFDNER